MSFKEVRLGFNTADHIQEKLIRYLQKIKSNQRNGIFSSDYLIEQKEQLIVENSSPLDDEELFLCFSKSLILDLLLQGWFLKKKKEAIFVCHSDNGNNGLSKDEVKNKVRSSHLLARDNQLQEASVAEFVQKMERRKLTKNGWISIFSLMRDGQELGSSLEQINTIAEQEHRKEELKKVVDPYIQFVEPNKKCEHTDLYLTDIWRYFRHTWITEYKSLPGRSISILIRDAAVEHHPVIGIAALGSSMAQLTKRDRWIGWDSEKFLEDLTAEATQADLNWMLTTLEELISEIYIEDLIADKLITRQEIDVPNQEIISFLREQAERYKGLHRSFPHDSKKGKNEETISWKERAQTHLFKSKRYLALAELLQIKKVFRKYKVNEGVVQLNMALEYIEFKAALGKLVRKRKGQRVGIDMMDIIICGAVAPYNHVLGGKLVCLLLTSPEVVNYYSSKYGRKESLIASAMGGKAIVRKPNLVFLATTSLYGVGSSQYNRIKMPISYFGIQDDAKVEYINLGVSEGFGSFHFSRETISWAHQLLGRRIGGRRVNSIFGEGANPLIRKMREAIDLLGIESEPLLKHENKRIIYGIPLVRNTREILLGIESEPDYLLPTGLDPDEVTKKISEYWVDRWLLNRIIRTEILEKVQENTKAYPITHQARVSLYKLQNKQNDLFEGY